MKPWHIKLTSGKKVEDSFIVPLWAPFKPRDFYFAIRNIMEEGKTVVVVYIAPREYYDNSGRMFHDSMPILHHLPTYMEETSEGVYEADQGINSHKVQNDFLRLGFEHNHYFQSYIDKNQFAITM